LIPSSGEIKKYAEKDCDESRKNISEERLWRNSPRLKQALKPERPLLTENEGLKVNNSYEHLNFPCLLWEICYNIKKLRLGVKWERNIFQLL
jgi:hypothetical protein